MPFMHNFDRAFRKLLRKIDVILFGNSEYITSFIVDLGQHDIIYDIGNLFHKKYKSSFIQYINKKDILEEISFHGINLKNNYLKSNDKKTDKFDNSLKIELRATFPKPLFIIKFFPILNGIVTVHLFNQYKLSKTQIQNPNNPNAFIYDNYKKFIEEGKKIFEKVNKNDTCNPKNKKLLLHDEKCKIIEGQEHSHGGYACGENGKWDKNTCQPYYCDIGYSFDQYFKKCVKDCASDSKAYFIFEDVYKNHFNIDKNETLELIIVNHEQYYL